MKNITLCYPNRIDEGALSNGSWLATLPLANLKNRRLSKGACSTNATLAATKFDVALAQARSVGAVALVAHNLSVVAKVRIRGDDAADFATPVYDSGWVDVWPAGVIPQSLLEWEDDNFWLGTLSQEALAGYRAPFAHYLPAPVVLRYWRVEIDDTANPAGTVQIGRAFFGPAWRPTYNMSYGASIGFEDATAGETSLSGEEFFDVRARYRVHKLALDWLTDTEAYAGIMDMQQQLGTSGELLVSGDPDDVANQPRRCFLARLKSLSPQTHSSIGRHAAALELKEIL